MIELTTSFIFLLGTFYGGVPADANVSSANAPANSPMTEQDSAPSIQPYTLEQYVNEYYKDEPILAEIARCESQFRHLGANGEVMRGEQNRSDIGVMQINEFYHADKAKELGMDLYSLNGNLSYARWLYEKEGGVPWASSGACWQPKLIAKAATQKELQ